MNTFNVGDRVVLNYGIPQWSISKGAKGIVSGILDSDVILVHLIGVSMLKGHISLFTLENSFINKRYIRRTSGKKA